MALLNGPRRLPFSSDALAASQRTPAVCAPGTDCADCGVRSGGDPGGGIYAAGGSLIIESSTLEDNSALSAGCDLYVISGVDAELFNTTIS